MNLPNPLLWQHLPREPREAVLAWLWDHWRWHEVLGQAADTPTPPLDDVLITTAPHAALHDQLADVLGVDRVDLLSTELWSGPEAWYTWHLLHAQHHATLALAAGV